MSLRRALALTATVVGLIGSALPAAATSPASSWVRVQFGAPVTEAARSALLAGGLTSLQYVPADAYVGYGSAQATDAAEQVPGVTGVRALHAADKIASSLRGQTGVVAVAVTSAGAADGLERWLGDAVRGGFDLRGDAAVRVTEAVVPAEQLAALAALPEVLHVNRSALRWETEDEGSSQVLAGNAPGGKPVPGYGKFLEGLGIDGSGVTISVIDDGVDDNHPEFAGRVKRFTYGPGTAGPPEGHGTHVAGIVGGKGATIGPLGTLADSNGLRYGVGVAPGVRLIDQPAIQLTNRGAFNGGFEPYTRDAVRAGAVAWNASWTDGGGVGVGYNANAASLDALTRDADFGTTGAQPFTFVFSAGNSGSGSGTSRITSPKEAKNIIAVASSKGHRAGNVDDISSFSSRGPALDGRVVPTVTAPGETIVSARATTGVLCTVPLSGVNDAPPADGLSLYTGCSGTSMASPHVAGSVALIHDWWRDRNGGADSSPAMDKALLVNTATDLRRPDIPNRDEGWGRVNLAALFDPTTERMYRDQSMVLTDPGDTSSLTVQPADPSRPVRVTLVWSDAPGAPGAATALVNDLDLTVTTAAGGRYLGNSFVKGESVPDGAPDRVNNVENVYLPAGDGALTVDVRAHNLPGDGVPGSGDATDQDFALVVSNAVLAP
ncbi:MAG: S8 family serine peptidase [Actinomycetota bacterium]|nr:S8 family serine peptidase [Actinomycetota bacterium]